MYVIYYPEEKQYYVTTVGRRTIDCGTDNFSPDIKDAAMWHDRISASAMMKYLCLDEDGCIVVEV